MRDIVFDTLKFIRNNPVKITIESRHLPGGADHNLICWICNKEQAVYSMHPNWVFQPCWKCQQKFEGMWTKKNWLQRLFDSWNEKKALIQLIKQLRRNNKLV